MANVSLSPVAPEHAPLFDVRCPLCLYVWACQVAAGVFRLQISLRLNIEIFIYTQRYPSGTLPLHFLVLKYPKRYNSDSLTEPMLRFKLRSLVLLSALLTVLSLSMYLYKFEVLLNEPTRIEEEAAKEKLVQRKSITPDEVAVNCRDYFQKLIELNQTTQYSNYVYDPITEESFLTFKKQQHEKSSKMQKTSISDENIAGWKKEYTKHVETGTNVIDAIKQQAISTRIFNQCFIKHHETFNDEQMCSQSEEVLFPWLQKSNTGSCLTKKLAHNSRPIRAIVITATNSHYENLISLFVALRAMENAIPIEIIHRGDLSEEKQAKLQDLARVKLSKEFDAFKPIFEHESFERTQITKGRSFPPLEVDFKDIKEYISSSFNGKFKNFSNKVLATLFSSYEEIILMDADVVPFIPPQDFFELEEYKSTGAFFFRDRELFDKSSDYDRYFWREMTPTEPEERFFGINAQKTKHDSNRYMRGFTHYLESGIVLLNRKKHFGSILHSAQFQLWDIALKRVWGDKEFFWISMMINGDDDFGVNEYAAGTFGEAVNGTIDLDTYQACAVQPVHLYRDKLLWVNSGMKTCKKAASPLRDKQYFGGAFSTMELMTKYRSPVHIANVVIPPNLDDYYLQEQDTKKTRSWLNMATCEAFQYCAKARVLLGNQLHQGRVVQFDDQQIVDHNYIGAIWVSAVKMMSEMQGQRAEMSFW